MLHNFFGVEIFSVGTWNGNEFSLEDLKKIEAAYQATKDNLNIPIKLGHNEEQKLLDGIPAAGWVENIRIKGEKLLADFRAIPEGIASLIHSGAYRKRSIELNTDFEIGGKKYPLILTGLALLGAKLPAVDNLADITKLYASLELSSKADADIMLFDFNPPEETFDDLIGAFDDFHNRAERFFKGKSGAANLRALQRIYKDGLRKAVGQLKESKETMEDTAIRKLLGIDDDADIEAALKTLKSNQKPAEKHEKEDDDETKTELGKVSGQVLELQKELAKRDASSLVETAIREGKLLPAQREFALKFAIDDVDGFKKFVESQPKVLEFGERGNSGNDNNKIDMSKLEPTADEIAVAKQMGVWSSDYRLNFMKQKAADMGVELPLDFGKEKEKASA